jgi:hypothetical protein
VKANHKGLLSQIEGALLPKITRQALEGILFNEADYQKNRKEFRCCAVRHDVSHLSETIPGKAQRQWVLLFPTKRKR